MFFGKSRKRKSNNVGTPEYDEWINEDNTQDLYKLQERMKKHGFEGGPGMNKDRWTYGDSVFDFDRPAGGMAEIWTISKDKLDELTALLDKLDTAENPDSNDDGELDYDQGFEAAQKSDDPTAPAGKSDRYYDGWNDGLFDKNNTDVGDIAKAITQNDLGRSL